MARFRLRCEVAAQRDDDLPGSAGCRGQRHAGAGQRLGEDRLAASVAQIQVILLGIEQVAATLEGCCS